MIDICTNLKQREIDCECMDCTMLHCLSEKIRITRLHSEYGNILNWTLRNGVTVDCFKTVMEEMFTEKQCGSTKTCYRALALLVYTYDVCLRIKDNDLKRKILKTVENGVSTQNVEWMLLMNDEHYPAIWDILKTLSLQTLSFLLNCYTYYLKMF